MDLKSIPDELFSIVEAAWIGIKQAEVMRNIMMLVGPRTEKAEDITGLINSYIRTVFAEYPEVADSFGVTAPEQKEKATQELYEKVFS